MSPRANRPEAVRAAIGAFALAATTFAAARMLRDDQASRPPDVRPAAPARSPLAEASELLANGDPTGAKRAFDSAGAHAAIRLATSIHGPMKWSRDGSRLAILSGDALAVFSTGDFRELSRLDAEGITRFALSDDGRLAALFLSHGDDDPQATFQIARTDTGEILGSVPGASQCTETMAFSPDGKLFAGATAEAGERCRRAVIWDIETRAAKHVVQPPAPGDDSRDRIEHVDFLSGGALLRTATMEGAERTWDTATGSLVASREGSLDVGPDGLGVYFRRFAAHAPKLFDTRTSKDLGELTDDACAAADSALFGPKGGALATLGNSFLCLWDAPARRLLGTVKLDERPGLDDVRFTPNGRAVVVGALIAPEESLERARVYSARTAEVVEDLHQVVYLGDAGDALLFHDRRSRELVRVTGDRTPERTSFEGRTGKFVLPSHRRARSTSPEPWGREPSTDTVVADDDGLALLDGATGKLVKVAAEPGKWQVQPSPDLHWMAGWDDRGHGRIWDLARRRAVRAMFADPGTAIGRLEIAKDKLTASTWGVERRLDLSTGALESTTPKEAPKEEASQGPEPLYVEVQALGRTVRLKPVPNPTFVLHPAFEVPRGQSRVRLSTSAIALSPDERQAAVGFALGDGVVDNVWGGEVRVFDLPSGRQTRRYLVPYRVYVLQFDADGGRLLAAGDNDPVGAWVWDMKTGKPLLEIPGADASTAVLSDRGDRLTLVIVGEDNLEVWDVDQAKRLVGPIPHVKDVATSEDGSLVAAVGQGTIRLFGRDGALVRSFPVPSGERPVDGAMFVGGLLAVWGGSALDLLRTPDGATAMSLRFGTDSALALSGEKVELFGDEAKARLFARCQADGYDFPLEWCEQGRVEKGLLAKLLLPR